MLDIVRIKLLLLVQENTTKIQQRWLDIIVSGETTLRCREEGAQGDGIMWVWWDINDFIIDKCHRFFLKVTKSYNYYGKSSILTKINIFKKINFPNGLSRPSKKPILFSALKNLSPTSKDSSNNIY